MVLVLQEESHQSRLKELDAITSDRDNARREFEALRKKRLDEFMTGFSVITSKLKEMYQVNTITVHITKYKALCHQLSLSQRVLQLVCVACDGNPVLQ